jgi:hypothetical protein
LIFGIIVISACLPKPQSNFSYWFQRSLIAVCALLVLAVIDSNARAPSAPFELSDAAQLGLPARIIASESAALWSDAKLYSPEGQAHDAWRLLSREQIAPLTAEAQRLILTRQFPAAGCANARFLISHGNGPGGIGSHLHVATLHLSYALDENRVFLWSESVGRDHSDGETCPGMLNLECFFQAPSSCTLDNALASGADTIEVKEDASERLGIAAFHVPAAMKALWEQSTRPAPHAMELKYWWRAQGAAFLARFNNETIEALLALRTNRSAIVASFGAGAAPPHPKSSMVGPGWPPTRDADIAAGKQMAEAFPFERGMTSMHVRHGDKGREMTLVADEAYFAAAESLVLLNPMGLTRAAFISTEDPATIVSATQERRGWAMMWYDIPRISSTRDNPGMQQLPLPRGHMTRIFFMQLLMALECDAWVGTRGSNWNRLVSRWQCGQPLSPRALRGVSE